MTIEPINFEQFLMKSMSQLSNQCKNIDRVVSYLKFVKRNVDENPHLVTNEIEKHIHKVLCLYAKDQNKGYLSDSKIDLIEGGFIHYQTENKQISSMEEEDG